MSLPLPPPSPTEAPILHEFSRPWRALRLPIPNEETNAGKYSLFHKESLMKNYEPQYTPGEPTFAPEVRMSSFLEPRVAVPEAQAFLITPRIRFTLGTVEPLTCRMLVYDISLGCRVTEEFCFRIPGPMLDKSDCSIPPAALVYVLPTLQVHNLYLVLKVSKVLVGDGDIATTPYCNPDKFASPSEQQKLVEKAVDCGVRLGRFQQPLAWGAISLSKGTKRTMSLFRQRACMSEEQRLSLISEAIRGILNEKARLVNQTTNKTIQCREVQPLCPPALIPTFGMSGSGPVAISYVNTLYVYPLQLEKCQHRNIAIRIQLLQKEIDAVRGVEEMEDAALRALYRPNNHVGTSTFSLVGYHQKNPQFENEIKICLPEYLTARHHLLFTFYHVHCKKLQPNQPQQELVGCAVLPILGKDGTIMQDGKYTMNVTPAPVSSKPLATGGGLSLSPGYVKTARDGIVDSNKIVFTCRSRVHSSIHSQDNAVAEFLSPFHGGLRDVSANKEDTIVNRLMGLGQSSAPNVRYFFFMIAKFVLGYLRFGSSIVRWSAFRTLLAVMEKASWNPRGSLKIHEMNRVLHDFVHIVFDEKAIDDPNCPESPSKASSTKERKSVFSALLETWLNVLNNKASIEENADTKRMSLTYSNVLLQLILKSMAMNLLDQPDTPNNDDPNSLPMMLAKNDEVMLERVLSQLVLCTGDTSNGLLLQKEVNRSVGYFCRGVFLVAKNVFPARIMDQYVKWVDVQGDANSLRHIWFPFLHILVDFEFFPTVNGAVTSVGESSIQTRAWLANAVSEKLLLIIDTQKEQKIKVDAVRLLRRMFAAQVYNPRFQTPEYQERIAVLYYPLFSRLVQFVAPGKLLAILDLQKEMLACVGHLLCSVSSSHLPFFFRPSDEISTDAIESRLKFTEAVAFYHRVVGKPISPRARCRLQTDEAAYDNNEKSSPAASQNSLYDEARVQASLALIQRMLDIFLVAGPANGEVLWRQLLSPDLSTSNNETGLSLLEHRLAHRRSFHRRTGGGLEASPALVAKVNVGDNTPSEVTQNATDGSTQKSLPRNWSKQYSNLQQRRSTPGVEEKALSFPSVPMQEGVGREHDEEIAALQYVVAVTALRVLQTAVDQYEDVIRLIEVARTPRLGKPDSPETRDNSSLKAISTNQALVLLGYLTELLFQLLLQASSISRLAGEHEHDTNTEEEQQTNDHDGNVMGTTKPSFVVILLRYLKVFVCRFSAALFAVRIPGLPLIHDQRRIQLIISIAATAKRFAVRRHAAMLLSQLLAVCYEQTGSFLLVKAPIVKVLTAVFFPAPSKPAPLRILTTSLRDLLDEMRTFASSSRDSVVSLPLSFYFQFIELLNDITSKVHAYERWNRAFENPDGAHDFEEIEEGIDPKDEFIYKRSKFMSLGEFVSEMKTMLRAKYPQCERVDVVPEPKSLTGGDNNPNVIFLRVTTVEEALPEDLSRLKSIEPRSHKWRVAFKFAVPFTANSSSYGKTSEQMKRITFLSVGQAFPCRLNRQRVHLRREETRCPIDNSIDDIQKRCALLRAEIDKENVGKTDLKTLTLVLKGSVDTHVHGGIPEVIDSFLVADPTQLVNAEGRAMSSHDSLQRRHELANLLVDFAQLCWQCLLISREAFRRSAHPGQLLSPPLSPSAPFHPELVPQHFSLNKLEAAYDNFLPPLPDTNLYRSVAAPVAMESSIFPVIQVSPLQTEFERSFAALVNQLTTKIPFAYKNTATLQHLHTQTASLRVSTSPAPVAPLPDTL
ncbi:hypothetical protein PHMEG_0001620 [Phytophthora megakarya]|uniref:C2 DOCK-type domain-containing protein n=1 Tax=Phytophthora megakarya TaxID=4795 RepID=A0A225X2Q2_9STRA|nr:hypothetical protein PHMEG_0001620 [Phytophthora megakarya]